MQSPTRRGAWPNILAVVQPEAVEFRPMVLQLLANPGRTVHVSDALAGLTKAEPIGFPSHQSPGSRVVQMRHRDMRVASILVLVIDQLKFFPSPKWPSGPPR